MPKAFELQEHVPWLAVKELARALHPRHLLWSAINLDDSNYACQHCGPITSMGEWEGVPRGSVYLRDSELAAGLVGDETTPLLTSNYTPERCAASKRAHDDFTSTLARIGQLDPLPSSASEPAKLARAEIEEANLESSLGFKRYLFHRGDAIDTNGSRSSALAYSWRFLRPGTIEILSKPRLAPLSGWNKLEMAFILFALAFNFIIQARACVLVLHEDPNSWLSWDSPVRTGIDPDEANSMTTLLIVAFLIKECFFVSFYLVWILVFVLAFGLTISLAAISAVLALFIVLPLYLLLNRYVSREWQASQRKKMHKFISKAKKNPFTIEFQRKAIKQAAIFSYMALNMSILYRIKEWITAVFLQRSRAVDFSVKLTSVGNVMFDLALMLCEDKKLDPLVVLAEVFALFLLFREMVQDDVEQRILFDAFKDLSQNRLTKLETALLLTKLTEDVVKEPAVTNFVEHFYTSPDQDETSFRHVPFDEWRPSDGNYLQVPPPKQPASAVLPSGTKYV